MVNGKNSLIYAGLAVLFWSTVATAFKIALRQLSPFDLLQISVHTSTIALLIIVALSGRFNELKKINKKQYLLFIPLAILNPVLYYQILFNAYDLLPAQTAQILNFTWPLMIVLFSFLFRLETFSLKKLAALGLSFIGTFIVITGFSLDQFQSLDMTGASLAFFSSFIWAGFWIINKKNHADPLLSLFMIFLFASIIITLQSILNGQLIFPKLFTEYHLSTLLPAIYVGLFEMSLTFILWMSAMKHSNNTAMLSNIIYFSPFLSLIVIRLVLKETILLQSFVGLLLIVTGLLVQWTISKRHKEQEKDF